MDSLPKELLFQDIINFINPITLPYKSDKSFIKKILIPHFENVKQKITNALIEREKNLKSIHLSLNKEVFSDYDIKKNYLNIDIYKCIYI